MVETIVGVILGGTISWAISHWYYNRSKAESPLPLLKELTEQIKIPDQNHFDAKDGAWFDALVQSEKAAFKLIKKIDNRFRNIITGFEFFKHALNAQIKEQDLEGLIGVTQRFIWWIDTVTNSLKENETSDAFLRQYFEDSGSTDKTTYQKKDGV